MEEQELINEDKVGHIEHYNPVNVVLTETTGIVALTGICLVLLFLLMRTQKQLREFKAGQEHEVEDSD